ncbi:MAG: hypothetical protein DMG07_08715 [Acidobacteria bacterium]|nr:MAG: hypothetical protein DMG07_08715 [Acidobacteriota bacterium]
MALRHRSDRGERGSAHAGRPDDVSAGTETAAHRRGGREAVRGGLRPGREPRAQRGRAGALTLRGATMTVLRVLVLLSTVAVARAQVPAMFPWWEGPIVRDLGLSEAQKKQILQTVDESRDRMAELRAAVVSAENAFRDEMNANQVDTRKAEDAIEKLVAARGDLMRAISQMSLKLRQVVTPEQWQELQKRQPPEVSARPARARRVLRTGGPESKFRLRFDENWFMTRRVEVCVSIKQNQGANHEKQYQDFGFTRRGGARSLRRRGKRAARLGPTARRRDRRHL